MKSNIQADYQVPELSESLPNIWVVLYGFCKIILIFGDFFPRVMVKFIPLLFKNLKAINEVFELKKLCVELWSA